MKDFIPSVCGDNDIYIPDEGCTDCDKLEHRVDELEIDVEVIENRFDDYYPKSRTYTQEEVDNLIAQIETSSFLEVDVLPEIGETHIIYLLPDGDGKQQWVYSNDTWINIGSTSVNMSDYVRIDEVTDMIHPIGDTVIRTDSINPGTLYTGTTWELISEGRMLIGADTDFPLGSYGGSADAVVVEHNHEQDAHTHIQNAHTHPEPASNRKYVCASSDILINGTQRSWPASSSSGNYLVYSTEHGNIGEYTATGSRVATNQPETATNQPTGVSGVGANMPPYLAVNIWRRIA